METDTKTFLEQIQGLEQKTFDVFSISKKENLKCKPLTFKQQKDIISTVAESTIGALKFQKLLNEIIIENVGENLSLNDKTGIILALRKESIDENYEVGDKKVSLDEVIVNFNKIKPSFSKTIKDELEVQIEVPTLRQENQVLNSTIESFKANEKEMGKNLGNLYTYEIVKYVKKVKIGDKEIDFSEISVKDRVSIVENIPLSTNKKIVDFIQSLKSKEQEVLKIDDEHSIDIDVSFFDS